MSTPELIQKCDDLRALKRIEEEAKAESAIIKAQIKTHMGEPGTIIAGDYKIKWQKVTSVRIDSEKLKRDLPDLYDCYSAVSCSDRLTVS